MTQAEQTQEWTYRYTERLGLLCADDKPTPEQVAIAESEADAAIAKLVFNKWSATDTAKPTG